MEWISPDNRVIKSIIERGTDEKKPSLFTECRLEIFSDNTELLQFSDRVLIVGDNCGTDYGRLLDTVLQFMSPLEVANVTFDNVSFKLKLLSCKHNGYIFEWDSARKLNYAELNKEKGVTSYKNGDFVAAAHRFSLALKLLHSIPIDVSNKPEFIDGVLLGDINALKVKLFNNLAMCESKLLPRDNYAKITSLCKKALELNMSDVKALNRLGSICQCQGDIDSAFEYYSKLATVQPNNTVAKLKLNEVALLRNRENMKVDDIYKKMFKN